MTQHGHLHLRRFCEAFEFQNLSKNLAVVFLGDYVDRGQQVKFSVKKKNKNMF